MLFWCHRAFLQVHLETAANLLNKLNLMKQNHRQKNKYKKCMVVWKDELVEMRSQLMGSCIHYILHFSTFMYTLGCPKMLNIIKLQNRKNHPLLSYTRSSFWMVFEFFWHLEQDMIHDTMFIFPHKASTKILYWIRFLYSSRIRANI